MGLPGAAHLSGSWYVMRTHSGVRAIILHTGSSAAWGTASPARTSRGGCPSGATSEELSLPERHLLLPLLPAKNQHGTDQHTPASSFPLRPSVFGDSTPAPFITSPAPPGHQPGWPGYTQRTLLDTAELVPSQGTRDTGQNGPSWTLQQVPGHLKA